MNCPNCTAKLRYEKYARKKTKQKDEKKYKLICVRKGKTNYAKTNNRKNVTLGSYNLCIRFVFPATALHFLVRWISRLIALSSKGVYIPSLHFFCENNPEPWPAFFVNWQTKTSFSIMIMGSYTSENNCSVQWRSESTGHISVWF